MRNVAKTVISLTAAWGLPLSALAQARAAAREPAEPLPDAAAPADVAPAPEPDPLADLPGEAPPPVDMPANAARDPANPPAEDPAAPQVNPMLAAGEAVLAERFGEIAQGTFRQGELDPTSFRLGAGLLRAATKLNPGDPRLPSGETAGPTRLWRLLVEAELQLGNGPGVLEALRGYRNLVPNDVVAQIQTIELYAADIEAVNKELEYLRNLAADKARDPQVRSHVGVMIARRMIERGDYKPAGEALERAIELNPVNVAAHDLRYRLIAGGNSGPLVRAEALLAFARANPARAETLATVGRLLADLGMHREAGDWMQRALNLYGRTSADPGTFRALTADYAAQLYLAGTFQASRNAVDQMLKSNPYDVDAWMLRLVLERGGNDKEAYARALQGAADALAARWSAAARAAMGEAPATQPAGESAAAADAPVDAPAPADAPGAAPEPAVVAKSAQASGDEDRQAAFIAAAADMAWFEVYFNEKPGSAAKWIDALEAVLPEDSLTLRRLRGWLQLGNKQLDEARKTFADVEEIDPLSALGMLRLGSGAGGNGAGPADKAARQADDDRARALLQENSAGLVGAMLSQALRDRGLKPEPHADAKVVRGLLQKFPAGLLEFANAPQRFYTVRLDPPQVSYRFGEPMYVRLTLQNTSDLDLSIAEGGAIEPGLWFDAEVQAMQQQRIPGVAFERIAQSTVLPARGAISQLVRFDQGNLSQFLQSNPTPRFQVTGWCTTNLAQQGRDVGPGPGGSRVPFARKMTRVGFQITKPDALARLVQEVEQGPPAMKMRNLELMAAYIPLLLQRPGALPQPGADGAAPAEAAPLDPRIQAQVDQAAALAGQMRDRMALATEDEVPAVAQWAKFQLTRVGDADQQRGAIEALLADPRWEGRMLGLVAVRGLEPAAAQERVAKVAEAEGEDPMVKSFAADLLELLRRPPAPVATQPAGELSPAEAPAPAAE